MTRSCFYTSTRVVLACYLLAAGVASLRKKMNVHDTCPAPVMIPYNLGEEYIYVNLDFGCTVTMRDCRLTFYSTFVSKEICVDASRVSINDCYNSSILNKKKTKNLRYKLNGCSVKRRQIILTSNSSTKIKGYLRVSLVQLSRPGKHNQDTAVYDKDLSSDRDDEGDLQGFLVGALVCSFVGFGLFGVGRHLYLKFQRENEDVSVDRSGEYRINNYDYDFGHYDDVSNSEYIHLDRNYQNHHRSESDDCEENNGSANIEASSSSNANCNYDSCPSDVTSESEFIHAGRRNVPREYDSESYEESLRIVDVEASSSSDVHYNYDSDSVHDRDNPSTEYVHRDRGSIPYTDESGGQEERNEIEEDERERQIMHINEDNRHSPAPESPSLSQEMPHNYHPATALPLEPDLEEILPDRVCYNDPPPSYSELFPGAV